VRHKSSTKYNNEDLEKALKKIVEGQVPEHLRIPGKEKTPRQKEFTYLGFSSPEDLCKTLVSFPGTCKEKRLITIIIVQ